MRAEVTQTGDLSLLRRTMRVYLCSRASSSLRDVHARDDERVRFASSRVMFVPADRAVIGYDPSPWSRVLSWVETYLQHTELASESTHPHVFAPKSWYRPSNWNDMPFGSVLRGFNVRSVKDSYCHDLKAVPADEGINSSNLDSIS